MSYTIQSLLDKQQFFDPENTAKDLGISSEMWPIFGSIWPTSRVLANIMLTEPLEERNILEIGCGLALPSLVIKKLGGNITSSDYHPLAETFLLENTNLNNLEKIPFQLGNWNICLPNPKLFDLIIGSDLLYERNSAEILSGYVHRNLDPHGELILLDPGRGSHRKFAKKMEQLDYKCSWTDLRLYSEQGKQQKGFIFRFSR